ncbi:MAG: cobalamin biosynthesis protein CobD [Alphaproteobacteria bacterium]|nr:cobalamin biosynthesis protein CobD [Alphaproteobacteria bacterium]
MPPDPLLLLFAALSLDALAGDMPALFGRVTHPVVAVGRLIALAEARLNRSDRSRRDRILRGAIVLVAMVAGAWALGWAIHRFVLATRWGFALEIFLVAVLVAQRGLFDHVRAVAAGLETDGLAGGRAAVAHIVGRDPQSLDDHGVARAAIESCAENFSDAVVAPVFWYVALGLPGLFAYKAVNTLDSMIGYRDDRFEAFGKASARFDDLINLAPARLAGLLVALAALFVPGASFPGALRCIWRDAGKHRSPNAGWPESAMAGALGLALAGPRHYPGLTVSDPWIGDGRARATSVDIRRALIVFAVACGLNALGVLAIWALR